MNDELTEFNVFIMFLTGGHAQQREPMMTHVIPTLPRHTAGYVTA